MVKIYCRVTQNTAVNSIFRIKSSFPQVGDGLSRLLSTCHERWQRLSADALQQADLAHALAEQPPRDAMH